MKSKIYFASAIILVALKLFGVINWSWWIMTAPFYLPIIWVIILCVGLTIYQYNLLTKKRRK